MPGRRRAADLPSQSQSLVISDPDALLFRLSPQVPRLPSGPGRLSQLEYGFPIHPRPAARHSAVTRAQPAGGARRLSCSGGLPPLCLYSGQLSPDSIRDQARPSTYSKWRSAEMRSAPVSMAWAAIQTSSVGVGRPLSRKAAAILEKRSAVTGPTASKEERGLPRKERRSARVR